jgi:hypothetical protein
VNVSIKEFDVEMKIKTKGIELDIYDNDGKHLGDCVVTKTRLIWCKGKTMPKNGKAITWEKFMAFMDSQ